MISHIFALMLGVAPQHGQYIPPEYDHPFSGYLIVEQMEYWQVRKRCENVLDAEPGGWSEACSWRFYDELREEEACHIVYPRIEEGVWSIEDEKEAIRLETARCNGFNEEESP